MIEQAMDVAQAASSDPIGGIFLQYGILGAVCLVLFVTVRTMDKRSTSFMEQTFKRLSEEADQERARANRLEDELRKLNESVRDDYVKPLIETARVMSDVLLVIRGISGKDQQ